MRAFTELWDEIGRTRYGVTNEKDLLFRYGVQVNSLGLTEQQPENNVYRILLEMLAVTLSKNARARSVQLPAWNEALGLPRPWDQQWSLRAQQILALETDLLGIRRHLRRLARDQGQGRRAETRSPRRTRAHRPNGRRDQSRRNRLHQRTPRRIQRLARRRHRSRRPNRRRRQRLQGKRRARSRRRRRLPSSPSTRPPNAAKSNACTPGAKRATPRPSPPRSTPSAAPQPKAATSWSRRSPAPKPASRPANGPAPCAQPSANSAPPPASPPNRASRTTKPSAHLREKAKAVAKRSAARQCCWSQSPASTATRTAPNKSPTAPATAASRSSYDGIRLTPAEIAKAAKEKKPHVIGLSILSGSHKELVAEVMRELKAAGLDEHARHRRRHRPPRRRSRPESPRRRPHLHAQGLRPERHHGRHARSGRRTLTPQERAGRPRPQDQRTSCETTLYDRRSRESAERH